MAKTNSIRLIPDLTDDDVVHFWSKVDIRGPNDCWPWMGAITANGYGCWAHHRDMVLYAHRVAYFLGFNKNPALLVCHHCDNRPCCNPAHLFEGTLSDNRIDCVTKGRWKRIHLQPQQQPKLSRKTVLQMRRERNAGEAVCNIAKRRGIDRNTASFAIRGIRAYSGY